MYEKYLPIGSVVLLKNATRRIMVIGFCMKLKKKGNKVYDYIGCFYPEGIFDTKQNFLFNHKDIDKYYAIGYSDDEEKQFKERLKDIVK